MRLVPHWLVRANEIQRRTFWACFAGWTLDAFDTQLYGVAIPALIATLGISRGEAGLISGTTLVTAAVGGWLGGAVSDRIGRLQALQMAVLWFAAGSLLAACTTQFPLLLAVKSLQGFGFGAEWTAGAVLIAETMHPTDRGKAMGGVQSGWAVGWAGALLSYGVIFSLLPPGAAWRVLFAIGVLPALLVVIVQRALLGRPEPTQRAEAAHGPRVSLGRSMLAIFSRDTRRGAVAGALLGLGAHGGYYGLFTWLPTYLKTERGFSVMATSGYLAVIVVSFGIGCLAAGHVADWIGRRSTVGWYAIGCIIVAALYLLAPIGDSAMLVLGFPLGFCAAGIPATLGPLFSELFPQAIRGSGVGFCYNFGRVASAAIPVLIGFMGERLPLSLAIGVDTGSAYALVIVALLLLPTARSLSTGMPLSRNPR